MEIKSSFPWTVVNLSTLQDLVYELKRDHIGNVVKTQDLYSYRFGGKIVAANSIDELKSLLYGHTSKMFLNLKLRRLSFSIKNTQWSITFDGHKNKKNAIFSDKTKHKFAKGKMEKFRRFWKDQIVLRYEYSKKSWLLLFVSTYIDQIDLQFALFALFAEFFSIFTWRYLYSGGLMYLPWMISFIQVALGIVPSSLLNFCLVRIGYWAERYSKLEEIEGKKNSAGLLFGRSLSMIIRIILIPLIIFVYTDSVFLSIFPTFPHTFMSYFADLSLREIMITLASLFGISLVSSRIRGSALNPARPIHSRKFIQMDKRS